MGDVPAAVKEILEAGVGPVFPGAVLRVARRGELAFEAAVGRACVTGGPGPDSAVVPGTAFDVASLTKPLATVALVADLVSSGALALDRPVGDLVPAMAGTDKAGLTVAQLLSHASGLPAWRPFGEWLLRERGADFAGTQAARAEVARRIGWATLETAPGTTCTYSDLGYILLGWAIEAAAGKTLDAAFATRVAGPLGMKRASFARVRAGVAEPLPVPIDEVAATELCPVRCRVPRGEVHDDNAFLLGGVAGHAGLFASAADVEAFATATWRAWQGERAGPLDPAVVRAFLAHRPAPGGTHVVGFDTPSVTGSSAGSRHPPRLVGHLGFTGASFWLDLDSGVAVVLLTNRVHPTRTNARIQAFRPALHDAVWTALGVPPV